jgi:hypothetical protein
VVDRSQIDARSDAIHQLSLADSLDALQPSNGFSGCVYVYPDKSWIAIWQKRRETEHHQPTDWHESIARDSDGEWFECTDDIGLLYSLSKLDPRFSQLVAEDQARAKEGDRAARIGLEIARIEQLLHTLTVGPDLPTARNALLTAGFKRIDPFLIQALPKIVVSSESVTVPAAPTTEAAIKQAALDQLTLNNIRIQVNGDGTTIAVTDDPVRFKEASLALLVDWPNITNADFIYCHVTDAGLRYFKLLPNLRELTLSGNDIDDAGLTEIADVPALEVLHLQSTQITDKGIHSLAKLKNLKELDISQNPQITGIGLSTLTGLEQLHKLNLSQTHLSVLKGWRTWEN